MPDQPGPDVHLQTGRLNALLVGACIPIGAAVGLLLALVIKARPGDGHGCPALAPGQAETIKYRCQYAPDQAAHIVHWLVAGTIFGLISAFIIWCGHYERQRNA
jgi:hypothetical protein